MAKDKKSRFVSYEEREVKVKNPPVKDKKKVMTVKDMVAYMAKEKMKKMVQPSLGVQLNPPPEREEFGTPVSTQVICQIDPPRADLGSPGVVETQKSAAKGNKDYGSKTKGTGEGSKGKKNLDVGVKDGVKSGQKGALERYLIKPEGINRREDRGQTQFTSGTPSSNKPEEGDLARPPEGNQQVSERSSKEND